MLLGKKMFTYMLFTDFCKTGVHGCMHTHTPPPPLLFPVKDKLGKVPAMFFVKS